MERKKILGSQASTRLNINASFEAIYPPAGLTPGQQDLLKRCLEVRLGITPSAGTGPVIIRGTRRMGGKYR